MKQAAELLAQVPDEVAAQLEGHLRELTTRNIQLSMEVQSKTRQLSAAAMKLSRLDAAMQKLRVEVAEVLEKTFTPREEHRSLLERVAGQGYAVQQRAASAFSACMQQRSLSPSSARAVMIFFVMLSSHAL